MKTVRTHFIHAAVQDEPTGQSEGTSPVTSSDLIKQRRRPSTLNRFQSLTSALLRVPVSHQLPVTGGFSRGQDSHTENCRRLGVKGETMCKELRFPLIQLQTRGNPRTHFT